MNIGDRVQSIFKGIPYTGRITHMNNHDRINSCIVTIELEKPVHIEGITLHTLYEQYKNLELVC